MVNGIVISADFSEPGSPILAGPTEDQLIPTKLRVAEGLKARQAALKELGSGHARALVIDHHFDNDKGWQTRRATFKRASGGTP